MGFFDSIPKWKMVVAEAIHLWGKDVVAVKEIKGEISVRIDVDKKVKIFMFFDNENKGVEVAAFLYPYQGSNVHVFRRKLLSIFENQKGYHIDFEDHGYTPVIQWRYTGASNNNHFSARQCVEGCDKFITGFYEVIEPLAYMNN